MEIRSRAWARFVVPAGLGALVFSAISAQEPGGKITNLSNSIGGGLRLQVFENLERLDPPKISPKNKWVFEWATAGFARLSTEEKQLQLKIRVFAQQKKAQNDPSPLVARMALRLWDFNVKRLELDLKPMYDDGRVHFYLCFGGPAGGEQLFDEDEEGGRQKRVNTIYIYQIQNVKDPVELCREVAHEFGHATLPPVGGFKQPEDWGNGYLGEKLYLSYLRDALKAKQLEPDDAMGATAEGLDKFAKREIDPLCNDVWLNGPDFSKLNGSGPASMNAYLGLALYAQKVLPTRAFARSLVLAGSTKAADFAPAIILAASEPESFIVQPPDELKGKDIWIPLGKGKLNGIVPLKRVGDWALVRPLAGVIRVTNRSGSEPQIRPRSIALEALGGALLTAR